MVKKKASHVIKLASVSKSAKKPMSIKQPLNIKKHNHLAPAPKPKKHHVKKHHIIKKSVKTVKTTDNELEKMPMFGKVPERKLTGMRVPSGIKNFDRLIEGGFDSGSTNLIVGGPGSGKSIFAAHFMIEGLKRKERCLYVTFEERKDEFYKNMLRFGWDLADYEKKGLFTFLGYTPEKIKMMLEEGGGAIEAIIIKNKISRLVIDSITSFALLFETEIEKRESTLSLFNLIATWHCTSLITYESNTLADNTMESRTLEFEADSIIFLHSLRLKGERENYLEILKMKGTEHSKKIYEFNITKRGIDIKKNPYKGNILDKFSQS